MYDYNYDLISKYEEEFCEIYNSRAIGKKMIHVNEAFKHDLEIEELDGNGKCNVELKVDFHKNSDNVFIETLSNVGSGRVGGPWQALTYEARYFIIWFPKDELRNVWVLETKKIINFMDNNKNKYHYCEIKNDGYMTGGYIVPKDELLCQGLVEVNRPTYRSKIMEAL